MSLQIKRVEIMPRDLEQNTLYISEKYKTAIHLCACGCGNKTVTPFNKPNGWELKETEDAVTLSPSIGNYSFDCKSHYWIRDSEIKWA